MPRLTIDNQALDVPAGATILGAARAAGIAIPALCAVPGIEPPTSCFVCVVAIEDRAKLAPACATVVANGMVVHTDTPEVLAARRTAVELLLSDHLGECIPPCELACPAGFHGGAFMDQVARGQMESAVATAIDDLVLPGVLGRVCPRFCENACRRRERDAAVAIGELHRFFAERSVAAPTASVPAPSGRKIAIIGTGPAGLAAADRLLRAGHAVTLFDSAEQPGGKLRYCFDPAVLPQAVLEAEIARVQGRGGEFRMSTALGRDVTILGLRGTFDAILLAVGSPAWQPLVCPGAELAEPVSEVMRRVGAADPLDLECDVIIIGAGQEAFEMALTARRRKATSVLVLCPRPQGQLSLFARTMRAAQSAGVKFLFEVAIEEIRQPALRRYLIIRTPAGTGKLDCNVLINATSRSADATLLGDQGVTCGPRGIVLDKATGATNLPGVFAAGDVVAGGGGFVVRAVAGGLAAAEAIEAFLAGRPRPVHSHNVRYGKLAEGERAMLLARPASGGPRSPRVLDEKTAKAEADRCVRCGCEGNDRCRLRQIATAVGADSTRFKGERRSLERDASHPLVVYESGKCIQCRACIAICQQSPEADKLGLTCVGRGFNVRVAAPWGATFAEAMGDLARRCAEACPTSAIVLKR